MRSVIVSILVTFCFFISLSKLSAQPYFAKSYDLFDHRPEFVGDMVLGDSTVFLVNLTSCTQFDGRCTSGVLIDLEGEVLHTDFTDCLDNGIGIVTEGNTYYLGGKISIDIPKYILYKSDITGSIMDCIELTIDEQGYTDFYSRGITEYNNQLVIYGSVTDTLSNAEEPITYGLIFWIDRESYDYTYTFVQPPSNWIRLEHMLVDRDGKLNVLAQYTGDNNRPYKKILRYNEDKELIWDWDSFKFSYNLGPGSLLLLDNGNIVMDIANPTSSDVILLCITPEGQEVWRRDFSENRLKTFTTLNLKKANNGDFLVVGSVSSTYYGIGSYASMMRVSQDGDLIWHRAYAKDVGWDAPNSYQGKRSAFYDVVELDNGDLMAAGYVSNRYDDPVYGDRLDQDLFVVRVSDEGCLSPNCEMVVEIDGETQPKLFVDPLNLWVMEKVNEDTGETYTEAYKFDEERVYLDDRFYYNQLLVSQDDTFTEWDSTGMYMREYFDRVYLHDSTFHHGEISLYDFDSHIMSFPNWEVFYYNDTSQQTIELDTIYLLNGEPRRVTYTRCWYGINLVDSIAHTWIQGIGDINGILSVYDSCTPDKGDRLTCFYHNDELLWQGDLSSCKPVSTSEAEEQLEFQLRPNPTSHTLTIDTEEEIIIAEIYSVNGQKLKQVHHKTFSVHDLEPGIFIIRILSQTSNVAYDRFMKI